MANGITASIWELTRVGRAIKRPKHQPFVQKNDRRNGMKSSRQDKTEGKLHEVMGSFKVIAGKVTRNRRLARKGKAEKAAGKAQEKIGQVKKVFGK
jgi:uncharacterized protein YjbJ (UPF0337 family)